MQDLEFESSLSEFSLWRSGIEHAPSTDNSVENISYTPDKSKKRIRKIASGFDYQSHINKELEKLERIRVLDEEEKKQVITRIRNRVSAQRSRTKQRTIIVDISLENQELQNQIEQLKKDNALLQTTLKAKSLYTSPERIDLEYENKMLKDTFRMKLETEGFLRARIKELETQFEILTRSLDSQVVRQSHANLSINTTKTFLFFLGLLMITGLFLGNHEPTKYRTMGFDFNSRSISNSFGKNVTKISKFRITRGAARSSSSHMEIGPFIKVTNIPESFENDIQNSGGNCTFNATTWPLDL